MIQRNFYPYQGKWQSTTHDYSPRSHNTDSFQASIYTYVSACVYKHTHTHSPQAYSLWKIQAHFLSKVCGLGITHSQTFEG